MKLNRAAALVSAVVLVCALIELNAPSQKVRTHRAQRTFSRGSLTDVMLESQQWCDGIRYGRVCCSRSCGRCGGGKCRDLPGGAPSCCVSTIRNAGFVCSSQHTSGCMTRGTMLPRAHVTDHEPTEVNGSLGVAVCITGQLSRLEIASKVHNVLRPLSTRSSVDAFLALERGSAAFVNPQTRGNRSQGCVSEPPLAGIEAALAPFHRASRIVKHTIRRLQSVKVAKISPQPSHKEPAAAPQPTLESASSFTRLPKSD